MDKGNGKKLKVSIQKKEKRNIGQSEKQKAHNKMVDLNTTRSEITLKKKC